MKNAFNTEVTEELVARINKLHSYSRPLWGKMNVAQMLTMPGGETIETPDDFEINDRQRMLKEGWPKMAFIEKKMAGDNGWRH
jgi:hypothetical protein